MKGIKAGLFILVAAFFTGKCGAQISPGELATVHSNLEGVSNCTKCHILGEKVSNEKCLDCHLELKERTSQAKGYHASAEVKSKECAVCHSDHHGLNFQIVKFDEKKFDHNLTGFQLKGAHSRFKQIFIMAIITINRQSVLVMICMTTHTIRLQT